MLTAAAGSKHRISAGRSFGLLATGFILLFGVVVAFLAIDQARVMEHAQRLQEQTVPEILRFQSLARNLEQMRQEGERVFSAGAPDTRQQAAFIVTLVASHPGVIEHPEAARLAAETERFISEVMRSGHRDPASYRERYADWQRLSGRLSVLVDDVAIQGVNRATADLREVNTILAQARHKLFALLALAGIFLAAFLALLHRHLIRPLQRIDRELSRLAGDRPEPVFPPTAMAEIHAVESAIGDLHGLLADNEATRQELETLANRDPLTGLMNRRHFLRAAATELERGRRYQRPLAIGMADLDHFKRLNDSHGHAAGDAVLRAVAALFLECLRGSDLVCRYGGEEFAFLFPESTPEEARQLAERIRQRCVALTVSGDEGQALNVTLSFGLADTREMPIEAALQRADEALYEAKRQGRNRVVLATASLRPAAES